VTFSGFKVITFPTQRDAEHATLKKIIQHKASETISTA